MPTCQRLRRTGRIQKEVEAIAQRRRDSRKGTPVGPPMVRQQTWLAPDSINRIQNRGLPNRGIGFVPNIQGMKGFLHPFGGGYRIVGIPGILVGRIGPDKPIVLFAQFQTVLKKEDVLEPEAILALVHRGPHSKIGRSNELHFGLEHVMKSRVQLEVVDIVIHQIRFPVPRRVEDPKAR